MDLASLIAVPVSFLESAAALPHAAVLIPALLLMLTALLVGLSVPGALTSLSFTSGAMLGLLGVFAVAVGAFIGTLALFVITRHWLGAYMQRRFGARLLPYEAHLARRGPLYVVGARLAGAPNVLVSAGCAAAPISARVFASASLLGMMPAMMIAALAGSAIVAL